MSGDHNQYQKDNSYLDFECPRCGHCCQAPWQGLTDEEVDACYFAARTPFFDIWVFATELEAKLKEKNHG